MAEGQLLAGESLVVRFANFVKLPHTLFALPFALLGVLAASRVTPLHVREVLLVIAAFTAARWVAMGFNRIADRRVRRAESAHQQPRAPEGGADGGAGVGVRDDRGSRIPLLRLVPQSTLCPARSLSRSPG